MVVQKAEKKAALTVAWKVVALVDLKAVMLVAYLVVKMVE